MTSITYAEAIAKYPLLAALSYGDLIYTVDDKNETDKQFKAAAKVVLTWRREAKV